MDWNFKEHNIHRIFRFSVILKGLHALIEVAGGLALYLVSAQSVASLVNAVTQEELLEDPRDFIASHLLTAAQQLSVGTQHFYAFYLLSHGLVKLVLVAGLLRENLRAYPLSLGALALFIAYQLYRYSYTHSIGLIVLTVFDLMVMALVLHEWKILRRNAAGRGA